MSTLFHADRCYLDHDPSTDNPERPERMEALLKSFDNAAAFGARQTPIDREASVDELSLAHTAEHIEKIAATDGQSVTLDADTQTSPGSYKTALRACGAVLELCDKIMDGEAKTAFSASRPPGHHAESNRAMGFCLYSNVAIAARYLHERHGLSRVAIVDFDVHHGNGTEEVLSQRNDALFISLHQSPLYPGTGFIRETGVGDGKGFTINVPMQTGCADAEYAAAMNGIVLPALRSFAPEFLLISAGFDAHIDDPLGGMNVTEDGYAWMTAQLLATVAESASGRCVSVLEGGYNIAALKASAERHISVMSGSAKAPDITPSNTVNAIISQVREAHQGGGLI